jgi:hypothetical protein
MDLNTTKPKRQSKSVKVTLTEQDRMAIALLSLPAEGYAALAVQEKTKAVMDKARANVSA